MVEAEAKALVEAAGKGDVGTVESVLRDHPGIVDVEHEGTTALLAAVTGDSAEAVAVLLKSGADANRASGSDPKTPLQACCELGAASKNRLAVLDALLKSGANPNAAFKDSLGPLVRAKSDGDLKVLEAVVSSGLFDLNRPDSEGRTPLIAAALESDERAMDVLLKAGADPAKPDSDDATPLWHAAKWGSAGCLRLLLAHSAAAEKVNVGNWKGVTPLTAACGGRLSDVQMPVIDMLMAAGADVNARSKDGITPLEEASGSRCAELVRVLLAAGADVNSTDKFDRTPLYHACLMDSADIVEALLKAGADPNRATLDGETPLMLTTSAAIADALLKSGADHSRRKNEDGSTALIHACAWGYTPVARSLIQAKADVHATQNDGKNAMDHAVKRGDKELIDLLAEAGAKATEKAERTTDPADAPNAAEEHQQEPEKEDKPKENREETPAAAPEPAAVPAAAETTAAATTEPNNAPQQQAQPAETAEAAAKQMPGQVGTVKSGWLSKLGGIHKVLRKRWMALSKDRLSYYANQKSTSAKGTIEIKDVVRCEIAYSAETTTAGRALAKCNHVFKVVTPKRTYYLIAENADDMQSWIDAFNAILSAKK